MKCYRNVICIKGLPITFLANEIFAVSSNVLLKGKLEESHSEINLSKFRDFSEFILDLAVTPSCVCIVLDGEK